MQNCVSIRGDDVIICVTGDRVEGLIAVSAEYKQQFRDCCVPLMELFAIKMCWMVEMDLNDNIIMLSTDQSWLAQYIANKSYIEDPCIVHQTNLMPGVMLWSGFDSNAMQKITGAKNGLTVITKHSNGASIFCFLASIALPQFYNKLFANHFFLKEWPTYLRRELTNVFTNDTLYSDVATLIGEKFYSQRDMAQGYIGVVN